MCASGSRLDPGPLDAARRRRRRTRPPPLDPERAAREAPVAQGARRPARRERAPPSSSSPARSSPGEDRLRVAVREPLAAADEAPVEARLPGDEVAVEGDLHRDAAALLVRAQAAEPVGELVGEHRLDPPGHVERERALGGVLVERRPGGHVGRDVRDVDPRARAVSLRAGRLSASSKSFASSGSMVHAKSPRRSTRSGSSAGGGGGSGRVLATHALVPEQSLEDGLDVVRAAEDTLEARPAGARDGGRRDRRRPHRRRPCGRRRRAGRRRSTARRRRACRGGRARRRATSAKSGASRPGGRRASWSGRSAGPRRAPSAGRRRRRCPARCPAP